MCIEFWQKYETNELRFVAEGAPEGRVAHGDLESPEPERIHPRSDAPEGRSIQNSGFRIQNWSREQPGTRGEAARPSILSIL